MAVNPYHEDDLIYVMTTPPERSSKLAPRWKGPFFVKRVPNAYQVTYEDAWCGEQFTLTMLSQPKPRLKASPSLCLHLNHHCLPLHTSRGVCSRNGQQNFLHQPLLSQSHLNQPPLPQSPPSQQPRHAFPESAHHTLISQSEIGPSL